MTILVIIAAIAFLAFVAKALISGNNKVVLQSNPVDGIMFGGVMGFMLGDSFEFCLSRFKHLDISVDSVDKTGVNSMIVAWGKNTYNNINEVRFIFENRKLASIMIDVDFTKEGIRDMYGILISRLSRVLGAEPYLSDLKQSAWVSKNCGIILFRHLIPISEEENLLIQIGTMP